MNMMLHLAVTPIPLGAPGHGRIRSGRDFRSFMLFRDRAPLQDALSLKEFRESASEL